MIELTLIPDSLSPVVFIGLIALSLATSMLTAAIGIGGGTIMLAILAQVLPIKAVIPVHGAVQLGSNFGRAAILVNDVRWDFLLWFTLGSLLGAAIGGKIVVELPGALLQAILGSFILYSVWGPKFTRQSGTRRSLAIGGVLSTLLTMFVGATGPFVLALLRSLHMDRLALVATNAACLVVQHALKILVFGILGFAFAPYLGLLVLMISSGFIGTVIGKRILLKVDEEKFQLALKIVLSVLAVRLLLVAVSHWY